MAKKIEKVYIPCQEGKLNSIWKLKLLCKLFEEYTFWRG